MRGLVYKLPCVHDGPENYALVVLGEDGVVYPLHPAFAEKIEENKALIELGFSEEELKSGDSCFTAFDEVENDPRGIIYWSEALTRQQRAMIAYQWVRMHPDIEDLLVKKIFHQIGPDLKMEKALQDVNVAILEPKLADSAIFREHAIILDGLVEEHRFFGTSGFGGLQSQMRVMLFEGVRNLMSLVANLVDEVDEERSWRPMDVALPMMGALGNFGQRPTKESIKQRKRLAIEVQIHRALQVVSELDLWDVEFEVE